MRAATNGTTVATRGMAKEAKSRGGPDQDLIRELASLLEETGLSEIEIEREGLRVRVARQQVMSAMTMAPSLVAAPANAAAPPSKDASEDPAKHPGCVKSPMVGTAYLATEPGAPPFIDVGTRVAQGQTILIIEAMKTMNHIPAPKAGMVTAILVGNGHPVEFGEPLVIIE
jgi:acetyl-CoA carboxylase biotin carboxyl carrier protein